MQKNDKKFFLMSFFVIAIIFLFTLFINGYADNSTNSVSKVQVVEKVKHKKQIKPKNNVNKTSNEQQNEKSDIRPMVSVDGDSGLLPSTGQSQNYLVIAGGLLIVFLVSFYVNNDLFLKKLEEKNN